MNVEIDAELPKLQKKGTLHALRQISRLGKITYDALRFMYRGYAKPDQNIDVRPDTGVVAPGKPLMIETSEPFFDIHYTTDGSEPTRTSPLMDHALAISDPAHTRLKSISTRGEFDRDVALHLRSGAVIKPDRAAKPGEKTSPIHYAYYDEKSWPRMNGRPFEQGDSEKNDPADPKRETFAARYERDYVIPADDYYAIVLNSTQEAHLWFAGQDVGHTIAHKDPRWRVLVLPLQAGVYRARLDLLHAEKGNDGLDVHLYRYNAENGWENEVK